MKVRTSMAQMNWTPRNMRQGVSSQTPGKKKDANRCQADAMKKFFAKRARARNHPNFADYSRRVRLVNGIR